MISIRQLRLKNEAFALATATSFESPLSNLSEVSSVLVNKLGSSSQLVIFDLLCSNGDEWNRFIAMEFDGGKLVRNTYRIIEINDSPLYEDLKHLQAAYFEKNPNYLEASILS